MARTRELIDQLRKGGRRGRAAARLLEQMGKRATPALAAAYDSPIEHFRWEIVNLLGYTRDPRAIPLLANRGIHDPELHPRWRSIWALTSVDDGSVQQRLRNQVAREKGIRKRNAAVALSLYRDPKALAVLRRGLEARDTWLRWESASCLAGYADARSAGKVLQLFSQEVDSSIRKEMVRVVEGVASPPVVRFLRRRLTDIDPDVRAMAAHVLAQTLGRKATKVLESRVQREPDSGVRREIRSALRACG